MSILYTPYISGTLPAFAYKENMKLTIPYEHNLAVSPALVNSIAVKILDLTGGLVEQINVPKDGGLPYFSNPLEVGLTKDLYNIGQYYKVQIGYSDGDEKIYYSAAGVAKCAGEPRLTIIAKANYPFVAGHTLNSDDLTEAVYSYRFDLKDSVGNIVATSGDINQNNHLAWQGEQEAINEWYYNVRPKDRYTLHYSVKTINGLEVETKANIVNNFKFEFAYETFSAKLNPEQGLVNFTGGKDSKGNGYKIFRSQDNFETWVDLGIAACDNTITFGETYQYAYLEPGEITDKGKDENGNTIVDVSKATLYRWSFTKESEENKEIKETVVNTLTADFQDLFLSDTERQLCIRFNPKVSSFKNAILESKTDTLGGPYPYFFRNGSVKYKEIPISGLISYLMDNEYLAMPEEMDNKYLFMPQEQLGINTPSINLTVENIAAERKFKLEVLAWLTNGKPKLFRSPTEGNYIVRLMNVSMSPEEKLGRMLHSFSATGYEVKELNNETTGQFVLGGSAE